MTTLFSQYYICLFPPPGASGGTAHVQNGISGSYVDAIFEVVEHEESGMWTSLPHSLPKKAYYSSQVSTVCVASTSVKIPYSGKFSPGKMFAKANSIVLRENSTRSIFAHMRLGKIIFYKLRVKNGASYVDTVFELVTHEQSEI